MRGNVLFLVAALCLRGIVIARETVVGSLPESAFADAEACTNVAFDVARSDVRTFDVRLELAGTASNCVQVAFGRDSDGDGVLALEETVLCLAWRGGSYCVENVAASERLSETPAGASASVRFLRMSLATDAQFVLKTASFENEAGPCFESLAASVPSWLFRSDWNLMRITRRGVDASEEWCRIDCAYSRFSVHVR